AGPSGPQGPAGPHAGEAPRGTRRTPVARTASFRRSDTRSPCTPRAARSAVPVVRKSAHAWSIMLCATSGPCERSPSARAAEQPRGGARSIAGIVTDVLVLCYHALSPTWKAQLSTTPTRFEGQIALLISRGYNGTTFSKALGAFRCEAADTPRRLLVVTFDDAYRSVFQLARPILRCLGLEATV